MLEKEASILHLGILSGFHSHLNLLRHRSKMPLECTEFHTQALADAHKALELEARSSRMGYPFEREFVRGAWLLGAALRETKALNEADWHLNDALERCRRINLVEFESDILIDLGRLRQIQGDSVEAQRLAAEAAAIADRCGYVLQGADAHLLLALLDKEAGNRASAREHAARARELATCDGPPDYTYKVAYDEAGALLAELG